MPIEWTIDTANGTVQAADHMGDQGAPTAEIGETGTYAFDFGMRDGDYATVFDLLDRAGEYVTYRGIGGQYHYREQSTGPSLLVGIDAAYADGSPVEIDIPRAWGLVAGGSDATPPRARHPRRLELEVLFLARRDDYATRADFQSAVEATGP